MNRIRILHIISGKTFSGEEEKLFLLCRFYNRDNIDVHVIVFWDELLASLLRGLGVSVHLVPMKSRFDLRAALRVAKLVKQRDIDIIISHTGRAALIARMAHMICRKPVITILPAPILRDTNSLKLKKWNFRLERWTSRWTVKYVPVNREIGEELIRYGEDPLKITPIYNGIDYLKFHKELEKSETLKKELGLEAKSNLVGMVAAFRPRKGAEYLVKAIPVVLQQVPETWFVFVGHGEWVEGKDYIDSLKELAASLNVDSHAIFTGFRRDIPGVIRSLDVVILPSLFGEGSSMVLMEAMALERPVISTLTEGNREVVEDGITGLLVPPADEKCLGQAIINLLSDKEKTRRMGEAGRDRVNKMFRAEVMTRNYEKLYEEILGGRVKG
jgi:glycosyltransferase involved in cell wall biosynthesis